MIAVLEEKLKDNKDKENIDIERIIMWIFIGNTTFKW
jgi:hypothetical protein